MSRVKNKVTDYGDLSYVQIRYTEMKRQLIRINDIGINLGRSLFGLISALNKLASLVGANGVDGEIICDSYQAKLDSINSFANGQIARYVNLNEEVSSRLGELNYLVNELFDEDGSYVTVTDKYGNETTKLYQDILKEKEYEEKAEKYKQIVENAGFTYYPEMGKYTDLTFDSVEEKINAFDSFIYTKAIMAGYTDKEAKMAIVISRWETGNYSKEEQGTSGYNYILPSNNNICGAKGGSYNGVSYDWGSANRDKNGFNIYSSIDESTNHYLEFLKNGYLRAGADTFTKIQPRYCPTDGSDKTDVYDVNKYWLNGCQNLYYSLFGEWVN